MPCVPIEQDILQVLQNVHEKTDDHITEEDINDWLNEEEEAGIGNEQFSDKEIIQRVLNETECSESDTGEKNVKTRE